MENKKHEEFLIPYVQRLFLVERPAVLGIEKVLRIDLKVYAGFEFARPILWVYPKATADVVDGSCYFPCGSLLNPQMHVKVSQRKHKTLFVAEIQ